MQTISNISPIRQIAVSSTAGRGGTAPVAMWHFVLSWVLLLPLYYFSANGALIPSNEDPSFAATGGAPTSHGSASHMLTVAAILLLCSILIGSRLQSVLSACTRMKVLLAFPILAILSSLWSRDPLQSLISGTILLVFTVFTVYIGDKFNFQEQLELVMLVGAIALPLSIALALFVPAIGASDAGWRGIFGHKQNCAAVAMLWLITALHWKCSGFYQRIFRTMYVLMCLVLIVMSKSRTGWALTLVALLLSGALWMMQRMPPRESLLAILITLAIVLGVGYEIYSHSVVIVTAVGKDPTLSQRTSIWAAVWTEIGRRPILGYGFNAFWKGLYGPSQNIVLASGWNVFQAQDGFLDVWLDVGLLGVALFALMVAQAMKNAICSFRRSHGTYVRWCIVVILCTLLYNIGESTIGAIQMVWLLFLLAYIGLTQTAQRARSLRYSA